MTVGIHPFSRQYDKAWHSLTLANKFTGKDAPYNPENLEEELEDLTILFPVNGTVGRQSLHPRPSTPVPPSPLTSGDCSHGPSPSLKDPLGPGENLRPIFVLGLPRSGTTLLEQVLSSHPEAWGAGENSPLNALVYRLFEDIADWGHVNGTRVQELRNQYLNELARRMPHSKNTSTGVKWVVDKNLGNVK